MMNTRSQIGRSHKKQAAHRKDNNTVDPQTNNGGDPHGNVNNSDATEVTKNLTGEENTQPGPGERPSCRRLWRWLR